MAILASDTLNVSQIDPATLTYDGLAVRERSNSSLSCRIEDIDGDGYSDPICQYQDALADRTLTGELLDGTPITGTDPVCVLH
ncbi:MAG: hypothetical protein AMJ65_18435 [Phycisphaerae bacterium SG8_4]|nr:MAG: hypothetical protein AMJ65_18435 [Phycisphaerae bacterium SG8_4]